MIDAGHRQSEFPASQDVDILAIAAHPDDVELSCGGTLIKSVKLGRRIGIIDLAEGEMASRGSVAERREEAQRAAEIMGVTIRHNLGLPDTGITNTPETRVRLAMAIRAHRP